MDELKLRIDQDRAQQAKDLLNNPLLKEALEAIQAEVVKNWSEAPVRDEEGKEILWRLYKSSQKFSAVLQGYIESGKLATEQLKPEKPGLFGRKSKY